MAITTAQIQQLYVAYLGRAADKAGLDYWSEQLNAAKPVLTLESLRANFVNEQPEYVNAYAGLSRSDTAVKIYNNLFGRAPDAAGLAYWTTGGGATVNADQLLTAFVAGAGATDAKIIANKVLVSEVYTSTAGANYNAADAKSIISGVTDTAASVNTAIGHLSDGTLSGIAVPQGVATLKLAAAADAAKTAFETTKVADVLALEKQLVTLSTANAQLADQAQASADTDDYSTLTTELADDLAAARTDGALGGKTTLQLTNDASITAADLVAARAALIAKDPASIDKITAYEKAAVAKAGVSQVAKADADQAVATLAAYGANAANATVWNKALTDAGVKTGAGFADTPAKQAQAIYDFLANKATSAANVAKIATDFSGVTNFTTVGTLAAKDQAYNKALDAFNKADDAVKATAEGTTWANDYQADVTAKAKVDASKALDALEGSYKAIDSAHTALVDGKTAADKAVTDNTTLVKAVADAGVTDKAEVFYFDHKVATADDFKINFEDKDSLFLGEGYTLNKTATIDATGIHGANNSALEVFFFKDAVSGNVKAVIETAAEGNTTVTNAALAASATDKVAIIELAGVTDVAQVTFANGIISHVA
ncbi:MAG: DUF4214 domain-containing protein [Pseudomonas sp.]|uniref:DUF4214 domain-containing protein n=1 Tax=Pseudomonas sp. TaxID=306 RepID=UPI002353686C|nr:DUF4214 domain-containing protein [Pseudomonas sp.]MBS5841707.1 DUF4214 domain-containing protein [Pseudomonas sp.]